jgi:hypothetical protein
MANRMTAPSNEMSSAGRLQAKVALIDGAYAEQGRQQQAGQQRAHNPPMRFSTMPSVHSCAS